MFYSSLLGNNTLRDAPHKTKMAGHALLLQGGYIRPAGQGLTTYLPLGIKVIDNINRIIREEMEALGGQEVRLPMTVPLSLFEKTERASVLGRELVVFTDRSGRKLVPAPSHIEPMVELVRLSVNSWRDFPRFLFQFQRKYRDEVRLENGLIRAQEFLMKDAYSFHRNFTDLNNFFPKMFQAYLRIFSRCQVPVIPAESAVGSISGHKAYEFLYPHTQGRDTLLSCPSCGYTANQEVALGYKSYVAERPRPLEEVETPGCENSQQVAEFLGLALSQVTKTLIYKTRSGFIMAVIRGDYEISLEKFARLVREPIIRLATPAELQGMGFPVGYLTPIGVKQVGLPVVVDEAVANSNNLVTGTNREGFHYLNTNFGRDFEGDLVGDLVRLKENDRCFQCGKRFEGTKVIELGNIFKLGDYFTRTMGFSYRDEGGMKLYPNMGSYGIGIGRLLTAIVEANHDERGIIWPHHLAPYHFFIMGIGRSLKVRETTLELHGKMGAGALLDDRIESPGTKFRDFELIGIPYRIGVSSKTLEEGGVEFMERKTGKTWIVPLDRVVREGRSLVRKEPPPLKNHHV